MNSAYILLPLDTVIGMELTGQTTRVTGLHQMGLCGFVVLICDLGFHLDGQESVPWVTD